MAKRMKELNPRARQLTARGRTSLRRLPDWVVFAVMFAVTAAAAWFFLSEEQISAIARPWR
jgi:hypothetical protein